MLAQVGKIVGRILVAVGTTVTAGIIAHKIEKKIEDVEMLFRFQDATNISPRFVKAEDDEFTAN